MANLRRRGGRVFVPEDRRYDYQGRCWWCGYPATTGEHKFKRSDLIRLFGDGAWRNGGEVAHVNGRSQRLVQSSKAKSLKFNNSLCGYCNSTRSQPYDTAYDTWSRFITANEEAVLRRNSFKWSDVFSRDYRDGRRLSVGYWLKHIGCILADRGVPVAEALVDFLNGRSDRLPGIHIWLEIRDDILEYTQHLESVHPEVNAASAWIGPMNGLWSRSAQAMSEVNGFFGVRWLRINWHLEVAPGDSRPIKVMKQNRVLLARGRNVPPGPRCYTCSPESAEAPS